MTPLLDLVVERVPPPDADTAGPFQMQVSTLDYSSYVGVIGIGRVKRGSLPAPQPGRGGELGRRDTQGPRAVGAREPRSRTGGASRSACRRHRLHHRGRRRGRLRHPVRRGRGAGAAAARHRRADADHGLLRQHLSVRGSGEPLPDQPAARRPAVSRGIPQRGAPGGGDRRSGSVPGLGPRGAAPVRADRDHAPRGLRGRGVAAVGHHPRGERRAPRALRDGGLRPRDRASGPADGGDRRTQGRVPERRARRGGGGCVSPARWRLGR